jgi:hypothetical protein
LPQPNEIDDLHLDHSGLDESWAAGEIEVAEQRPSTALTSDPSQRKWMLAGVVGCAVITSLAVVLLTGGSATPVAEPSEPAPVELAPAAVVEPEPSPSAGPEGAAEPAKPTALADAGGAARRDTTLAAGSPAAASDAAPKPVAPGQPTSDPVPAPAKPASGPSQPSSPSQPSQAQDAASKPQPASGPALPSADPSGPSSPTALPDVEGWDNSDESSPKLEAASASASSDPADDDAQV